MPDAEAEREHSQPMISAMPEQVMESSAVDFVLRGEGEVSMTRLAKALHNGQGYDDIPGLVYRGPNDSLHVGETVSVRHLDDLPSLHRAVS